MIIFEIFTNDILAENIFQEPYRVNSTHKIMVLKPANNYRIIQHCHKFKKILVNDFQHHPFLY